MANSPKPCAVAQKQADGKIVSFDEYRRRSDDLHWAQMSFGEKLFDAFVNVPYNMILYVRRGFEESWQTIRGRAPESGTTYVDGIGGGVFLDRAAAEADHAYALQHGLSKKFQEKSVRLSREAFDACADFSVIKKSGQLQPLYPI
jgi:hypothetical protein